MGHRSTFLRQLVLGRSVECGLAVSKVGKADVVQSTESLKVSGRATSG